MLNAFLLSILLIVALKHVSHELRLVDLPDLRKKHVGAVPLCGGLAVFSAFMIAGIGFDGGFAIPWNWEVGFGMLVVLGIADDRWSLPALPRLFIQALAAAILVAGLGPGAINLGALTGEGTWILAAPGGAVFAVIFIVGTINAVNMTDGLDGLAGSSVAAALLCLALVAAHTGDGLVVLHALVLLAAVAGFLVFNLRHPWRRSASVFLGDGGSLVLGATLAFFIVHLASSGKVAFPVLLWIVVVPIADTLSLIVRRLSARRSPLSPDRWHLHHLFVDAGVPPALAAGFIAGASALCGAIGLGGILLDVPEAYMTAGLAVPLVVHAATVFALRGHLHAPRAVLQPLHIHGAAPPQPQILRDKP